MFELVSPYQPAGDQPQEIDKLTNGIQAGAKHQVLLGVTGSGKTFHGGKRHPQYPEAHFGDLA